MYETPVRWIFFLLLLMLMPLIPLFTFQAIGDVLDAQASTTATAPAASQSDASGTPSADTEEEPPTGTEDQGRSRAPAGTGWRKTALVLGAATGTIALVALASRVIIRPWGWRLTLGDYKVRTARLTALDQALGTRLLDNGAITIDGTIATAHLSWLARWRRRSTLDVIMLLAASAKHPSHIIADANGVTWRDPEKGRVKISNKALRTRLRTRLAPLHIEQAVTTRIRPCDFRTNYNTSQNQKTIQETHGGLVQLLSITAGTPYAVSLDTRAPELILTLPAGSSMAEARRYTAILNEADELGLRIVTTRQLTLLREITRIDPPHIGPLELPSVRDAVAPLTEAIELGATITGDDALQLGLTIPEPLENQRITWFTPSR